MTESSTSQFEGWVILELMGHRKIGGYLKEEQIGGASFLRIDILTIEATAIATQFYNPSAVYCITPTTEGLAKALGTNSQPAPVTRWELPEPKKDYQLIEPADEPYEEDSY